jgi:hypothetical protein
MARIDGSPAFLFKGKGGKIKWINFSRLIKEKISKDSGSNEGGYSLPPNSPDQQYESLSLEKEE